MWPSLKVASTVFDAASATLVGTLVFGAVATLLIVWMGYVKEHHWDTLREIARQRTEELAAETARANADTARAHERIAELQATTAEANARSLEAQVALERFRAPRLPTPEALERVVRDIRSFAGTKFDIGHGTEDLEQMDFLWLLEPKLSEAGWIHVDWTGGDIFKKPNWPGDHLYGRVPANNVSIELHLQSKDRLMPAAEALVAALNAIGIAAAIKFFNNSSTNVDALHLLIGPKR